MTFFPKKRWFDEKSVRHDFSITFVLFLRSIGTSFDRNFYASFDLVFLERLPTCLFNVTCGLFLGPRLQLVICNDVLDWFPFIDTFNDTKSYKQHLQWSYHDWSKITMFCFCRKSENGKLSLCGFWWQRIEMQPLYLVEKHGILNENECLYSDAKVEC